MSGTSHQTFACPQCGTSIVWSAPLAGKRVKCKCGRVLTVPAEAPSPESEDIYDMVDEPLLQEVARPQPRSAPALQYESKETSPRMTFRDLLTHPQVRGAAIAVVVIVAGVAVRFCLPWFLKSHGNVQGAGMLVALGAVLMNIATMLIGVGAVTRFTGADLGSIPVAVLKLGAIAVISSTLFAVIASVDNGDGTRGMVIAWHGVVLFNWIMFTMLFELDIQESLFCAAAVGILQAVGVCGLALH